MFLLLNYMYVCGIVYVVIDSCACRGQERTSDLRSSETKVRDDWDVPGMGSGTKLWSSERTICTVNC